MKALHFGAGNIGRGFIGQLLVDSGFDLTFIDIDHHVINMINKNKKYNIQIVENDHSYIQEVEPVKAINVNDSSILFEIAKASVITISVGINVVYSLVQLFAKGIKYRMKIGNFIPLNIIVCENIFRCASQLKIKVKHFLSTNYHQYLEDKIGFIDSVVDRIVCSNVQQNEHHNLLVKVEKFKEWIVDRTQFRSDVPNIVGLMSSNYLDAFFERKFFTLNTGHAITAYLGLLKKYNSIYQAISDPVIYHIVYGAMRESGLALIKKHNCFSMYEHNNYIRTILFRFKNIHLTDSLKRVARNPLKKLEKNDRLIGPLINTLKYNFPNANLLKGISAALCYFDQEDIESLQLKKMINNEGIKYVLSKISCLDSSLWIFSEINIYFNIFKKADFE